MISTRLKHGLIESAFMKNFIYVLLITLNVFFAKIFAQEISANNHDNIIDLLINHSDTLSKYIKTNLNNVSFLQYIKFKEGNMYEYENDIDGTYIHIYYLFIEDTLNLNVLQKNINMYGNYTVPYWHYIILQDNNLFILFQEEKINKYRNIDNVASILVNFLQSKSSNISIIQK